MGALPAIDTSGDNGPLLHEGEIVGGRYRIERYLGGGGMAAVYRATHEGLDQPVALKVVSPTIRELPGIVARFMREARAATRLKGEHVVRVFDVGTTDRGAPYLAMELLEGKDLSELLESGEKPSVDEAIDYILQTCEALAEVHGLGIVHRDLKPANLFLARGADGMPCLKLIDFGISRVEQPLSPKDAIGLTNPDVVMGSPRYMPPEQMESAATADMRSDIWGLGTILYEMLCGDAPFDGESLMDIYAAAVRSPPPSPSTLNPAVPEALDRVILKCLAVEKSERFADVAELALALAPIGDDRAPIRAEAIARVLDAARARGQGSSEAVDTSPRNPSSRIRKRSTKSTAARNLTLGVAAIFFVGLGVGAKPIADRGRAVLASPAPHPVSVTNATVETPVATGPSAAEPVGPPLPSASASATTTTKPSPPETAPPVWRPAPTADRAESLFEERK